jgi:hypothetical protein
MGYRYCHVSASFSSLIDLCRHSGVSQLLIDTAITTTTTTTLPAYTANRSDDHHSHNLTTRLWLATISNER